MYIQTLTYSLRIRIAIKSRGIYSIRFQLKGAYKQALRIIANSFFSYFDLEQELKSFELLEPLKVVRGLFRDCTELIMSFALSVFRSAGQLGRHHIFHLWNGPMFTQQFQLICGEEIEQIYALDKQTILDHTI